MREKLRAMPSRSAQPATKLAKPMPTPSITATPRKIARSRRRPTFCAAKRISSQRSCRRRDIAFSALTYVTCPGRGAARSACVALHR